MMNPFREFATYTPPERELPLDRILARRARAVQHLLDSHQALLDAESKQLIWVAEQGALSRAYTTAVANLQDIDFTVEDLEDVCLELDQADGVATPLGAPSGLFIAAMCNQVEADDICLNLRTLHRRWPFLGYRLPRGRRLRLEGDAGDFVGALLEGGELLVTGNAGNYAGVGMKDGHVHIRHNTGKYTGEGMRGGILRIDGHIGDLGSAKHGIIYEDNRQIFPSTTASAGNARAQRTRES